MDMKHKRDKQLVDPGYSQGRNKGTQYKFNGHVEGRIQKCSICFVFNSTKTVLHWTP